MKVRSILTGFGVAVLSTGLIGCSFSASFNSNGRTVVNGDEAIIVAAQQPEAGAVAAVRPILTSTGKVKTNKLRARLVGSKIEISEKVMFDYNKDTIKVESHSLLKDVFAVISEKDSIKKIRIEGHTDADGNDKYNKKLSQKRADSVKAFLVQLGVDESRLESVGYGEERPIASNDEEAGKEQNRRVEFNVVKGGTSKGPKIVRPIKKAGK